MASSHAMVFSQILLIGALSLRSVVSASPPSVNSRSTVSTCIPTPQASLPKDDCDPATRAAAIETKREGFLYGPSLIGDASFFPAGPLGNATVNADLVPFLADQGAQEAACVSDAVLATTAVSKVRLFLITWTVSGNYPNLFKTTCSGRNLVLPC
jgi:hypothetical protein